MSSKHVWTNPATVITSYVTLILFAIIFAWIFATKALGKQFSQLSIEKNTKAKDAAKQPASSLAGAFPS